MDHSYSTECRDKYQSRDHSYFRYARKVPPLMRRLYNQETAECGRQDHSYYRPQANYGCDNDEKVTARVRKPLMDANQQGNLEPEDYAHHFHVSDGSQSDCTVSDECMFSVEELGKDSTKQIINDHPYHYSKLQNDNKQINKDHTYHFSKQKVTNGLSNSWWKYHGEGL